MLKNKLLSAMGGGVTDPYFDSVILLLNFDGTEGSQSFYDSSNYSHQIFPEGNARIITGQVKNGTGSLFLDGNVDSLRLSNSNFNFGTASFTVEFWFYYFPGQNGANKPFLDSGGTGLYLGFGASDSNLIFYSNTASLTDNVGAAHGMIANAWNHLAFVRNNTTVRIYVNGVEKYNKFDITGSMSPQSGSSAYIGTNSGKLGQGTHDVRGYLDDFRITKGVARYTANFTPPEQAFPNN